MASASNVQESFAGGEWSQAMQGQMSDPRYRTALNVCFNALPVDQGAWTRRPPTQQIAQLSGAGRVISFVFPDGGAAALLFTDNKLQPLLGVTWPPAQTLTTTYVKGSSNDWTGLRLVQAEEVAVLLNGNLPYILKVLSGTTFGPLNPATFADGPYLDIPTDGTTLTPSGLTNPVTVTLTGGLTRFTPGTDVGRLIRIFSMPPVWAAGVNYTNGQEVYYDGNVYQFVAGDGTSTSTGKSPPLYPYAFYSTFPSAGFYGWEPIPQSAIWTWGVITAVADTTHATVQLQGPALLYTNTTLYWRLGVYSNTTGWPTCGCYHEGRLWLAGAVRNRIDASMNALALPDATYGALTHGVTNPIFAFSPTDIYGNVADSNGISATFLGKSSNKIFWMEPDQQGIICGTRAGEWLIQATSANLPLTPTSIQAHQYTSVRCANAEQRRCNLTIVFIQLFQRKIMEYFSDLFSGKLTAPNLTKTAKHLTVPFVQELAYQQETSPVLWARLGDGTLIGCTYNRESLRGEAVPEIAGWHRHALGSARIVQSIAIGSNAALTLDALALVTFDGSTYWLELMNNLPDENVTSFPPYLDAWSLPAFTAGPNGLVINGLNAYSGKTVTVMAAGLDLGDWPVDAGGALVIPYGDGINQGANGTTKATGTTQPGGGAYLFTAAVAAAMHVGSVVVGFTYQSRGQRLRPATAAESGARSGPAFGKIRRSQDYMVQCINSQGLEFGSNFTVANRMGPGYFRDGGGNMLAPTVLFSGVHWDALSTDDYSFDGMLAWRVTRPYPATVVAIGTDIHTQDR